MTRPFAVFDIDGTLIRWQLYHAAVDALANLGHIKREDHQAIKDARMNWKRRAPGASFKSYEQEAVKLYEKLLFSLTVKQFEKAAEQVLAEYRDQVYTFTRDLISDLKSKGYLLFAISGSHSELVSEIAKHYGFDDFSATVYHRKDGKFTGTQDFVASKKDEALEALVKKHKATYRGSVAVGDSLSDAKMLQLVEQPIAFNPEKELFDHAKAKGWPIIIERKNVVYRLERVDGRYCLAKTN